MSRYTRVDSLIWNSSRFLDLSIEAKALYIYYLTGTHNNSCGMFPVKDRYTKVDLPMSEKDLQNNRFELIDKKMIEYDADNNIVLILNQLKFSAFQNPSQAIGGFKQIEFFTGGKLYQILRDEIQKHCPQYLVHFPNTVLTQCKDSVERGVDTPVNVNDSVNGIDNVNVNGIKDVPKPKKPKVNYPSIYEHYLSLPLVKHEVLTGDMKKAISKALEQYNKNDELLKRMATRHAEKVELTKDDGQYKTNKRSLTDFYGQKKYESTALICSDYDDGVYEQWYKNYKEKKGKTNGTEKYKAGESGWDM